VLRFGEFERKGSGLLLAQLRFGAKRLGRAGRSDRGFDGSTGCDERIVGRRFRAFGNGSGFGFGAAIGEKPARQSPGEATGNARAGGRNGSAGQIAGCARSWLFKIGLRLMNFGLGHWRRRRNGRLASIFGKRFAGQKDGFFRNATGGGGSRSVGRAMVEATLRGAARFEPARLASTIFRDALIAAAIFIAAGFVATRFAALR
jgi:hypothetical protein